MNVRFRASASKRARYKHRLCACSRRALRVLSLAFMCDTKSARAAPKPAHSAQVCMRDAQQHSKDACAEAEVTYGACDCR